MTRRHAALVAIVFTTGCSLIWDMDPYEPHGTRATSADGGGDASSSGASSGGSSGGSSGTIGTRDGGADAADAKADCPRETEPNDTQSESSTVVPGKNCGAISSVGDIDNWSVVGPANLTIVIPSGIQFNVVVMNGGSILRQEAGSHSITLGTGTHRVTFQTFDGTTADYDLTR